MIWGSKKYELNPILNTNLRSRLRNIEKEGFDFAKFNGISQTIDLDYPTVEAEVESSQKKIDAFWGEKSEFLLE